MAFESPGLSMRYIILLILMMFLPRTASETTIGDNTPRIVHELPTVLVTAPHYHSVEAIQVVSHEAHVDTSMMKYYDYFQYIADRCPFEAALVAGYFNLETYYGTSSLWKRAMNPSGIVSHRANSYQDGTTYSSDDGGSTKAVFNTIRRSADGWAQLFGSKRYRKCATLKTTREQCHCIWTKEYHTSPNWQKRVDFVNEAKAALKQYKASIDKSQSHTIGRKVYQTEVYPRKRDIRVSPTIYEQDS